MVVVVVLTVKVGIVARTEEKRAEEERREGKREEAKRAEVE